MNSEKLGQALQQRLETAHDYDTLDVNIFLKAEPAREWLQSAATDSDIDAADAVQSIRSAAQRAQASLLSFLSSKSTRSAFLDEGVSIREARAPVSFWLTNAVGTKASKQTLSEILQRDDVSFVELNRRVPLEDLLDAKRKRRPAPKRRRAKPRKKTTPAADAVPVTWSVERIGAPLLWQLGLTGDGIRVALIDTGVNYKHPDLKQHMWDGGSKLPNHGYDFENDDNDPRDDDGHGTATAGQVAGDGTAGTQTGVAPRATIMAIRVGGVEQNFWNGMQFALDHKAHVISMSMSWKYPSHPNYPGWRRACETVLAAGVLHANSVGNQGNDLTNFPIPYNIATPGNSPPPRLHPLQSIHGGLSSPISCGATDDADALANYSGRGPAAWEPPEQTIYSDYPYQNGKQLGLLKPDVCAPGSGTTSCNYKFPDTSGAKPYRSFGGTSAATPHVGGCLALLAQACLRSKKPINAARIQESLENTAVRIRGQTADKENHYGAGRVDVYAAFKYGKDKGWWA
jgi:subtilisin family serine protease